MKDTGSIKDVQFTEDCRLVDDRARASYPGVPPPRNLLMRREGKVVGDPRASLPSRDNGTKALGDYSPKLIPGPHSLVGLMSQERLVPTHTHTPAPGRTLQVWHNAATLPRWEDESTAGWTGKVTQSGRRPPRQPPTQRRAGRALRADPMSTHPGSEQVDPLSDTDEPRTEARQAQK